jgi:hypothetical protein
LSEDLPETVSFLVVRWRCDFETEESVGEQRVERMRESWAALVGDRVTGVEEVEVGRSQKGSVL